MDFSFILYNLSEIFALEVVPMKNPGDGHIMPPNVTNGLFLRTTISFYLLPVAPALITFAGMECPFIIRDKDILKFNFT
jgi:hypothetical protein